MATTTDFDHCRLIQLIDGNNILLFSSLQICSVNWWQQQTLVQFIADWCNSLMVTTDFCRVALQKQNINSWMTNKWISSIPWQHTEVQFHYHSHGERYQTCTNHHHHFHQIISLSLSFINLLAIFCQLMCFQNILLSKKLYENCMHNR
jgi:hypothetical protein